MVLSMVYGVTQELLQLDLIIIVGRMYKCSGGVGRRSTGKGTGGEVASEGEDTGEGGDWQKGVPRVVR